MRCRLPGTSGLGTYHAHHLLPVLHTILRRLQYCRQHLRQQWFTIHAMSHAMQRYVDGC